MLHTLNHLVSTCLASPTDAAKLVSSLHRDTPHLDDEVLAALLEQEVLPDALAHLLRCDACATSFHELHTILAFETLPHSLEAPEIFALADTPLLAASIVVADDHAFEVVESSGVTRVSGALEVRRAAAAPGLTLRDRRTAPQFELALLPSNTRAGRFSLACTWLGQPRPGMHVRVSSAGRVLAQAELHALPVHFADLRIAPQWVAFMEGTEVLGLAWLQMVRP